MRKHQVEPQIFKDLYTPGYWPFCLHHHFFLSLLLHIHTPTSSFIVMAYRPDLLAPYLALDQGDKIQAECRLFPTYIPYT